MTRTNSLQFTAVKRQISMIDPQDPSQSIVREVEIRKDPLLDHSTVIAPHLTEKVLFGQTDYELLEQIAESSRKNCFMCGTNIEQVTPGFNDSPSFPGKKGRIRVGEAVLFPNLFPLAKHHAVVALSKNHFVDLRQITPEILSNAILASLQFIKWANSSDPKSQCFTINANFLHPSGGSASHPHIQVLGGSQQDFSFAEVLWQRCKEYFQGENRCYWLDILAAEKEKQERYLWQDGLHWFIPFAPLGNNEVVGVFPRAKSLIELTHTDVECLADGLTRILRYYASEGYSTFNWTLYSGPLDPPRDWFRCFVRILTRQNVSKNYRNDIFFIQKMLGTEILPMPPEELAQKIKDYLKSQYEELRQESL